ncbi:2-oxo acid dehydrogenase subunit E2 [Paenarthrobacter sp. DKR-5]|uniref:dihydrolipoamide acetyltransferase family protein n=1 Tax=Paenarthrobacter sp. DKR-5 TaxID=2835535 RepID=UPI001BDCBFA2|nr:dihydrolipoamide acetyltransferase family protein [Paenarthrobacter sp. DKR-5]MBT1001250.1 2-oxo acid dehydrogenase subunit E2 [Paenarthrobacter sp. DKR-5]
MPEPKVFLLPDLGEGLTEAELVTWLVKQGEQIEVDQPVAEVETAKAVVEVPSPYAGVVAVLHAEPGQSIDVGKPLVTVAPAEEEPVHPAAEAYREEEKAGSGNVLIGYGTSGHGEAKRSRRPRGAAAAAQAPSGAVVVDFPAPRRGQPPLVVSPLVRRLARDNAVALDALTGSGPGGLILRRDVLEAIPAAASRTEATGAEPVGTQPPGAETPGSGTDPRTGLSVTRTPLRGVRRTVAEAMVRSRREIPEATVWVDVDATELVRMRESLKRKDPHAPGLLSFIARFVTAGLQRYPELNTRVEGDSIVSFGGVNLGFAAQTDRGLVVPSVRDAHLLSVRQLDAEIRRLTDVARSGKASPEELTRGTFTLNNYGVFGVDGSAAIINYPEAAILGVGRIIDKPWVVDGELAVRKVTELALVFDHRVCDGGTAGGFLRFVADAVENPGSVLVDL